MESESILRPLKSLHLFTDDKNGSWVISDLRQTPPVQVTRRGNGFLESVSRVPVCYNSWPSLMRCSATPWICTRTNGLAHAPNEQRKT